MAEGIVKRHSQGCRSRDGQRCNCGAGHEAWIYVHRGGRHVKLRKTFKREVDAKVWRAQALAARSTGELRTAKRDARSLCDAVSAFVDEMREGKARPRKRERYKPATIRSYEQHVRVRLRGSILGTIRVGEVTRADVQAFVDERLAEGDAPGTIANALCPVQAFYRHAIDRDELAVNPAARVDVPVRTGKPKRIASASEAATLLAALPEADRPLWATAFYAGLRRGELQALRWRDVDLATSRINVERNWDQYEGAGDPKSAAGRRSVPLLAVLRDHLDEHKLSADHDGDALVFGRATSEPFSPPSTDRRAQKAWKAAGLKPITQHECRHTFASLLIDAGANAKAIQTFMGHSKIQTTFDIYGHLMPGSHDEVRERMDAYLARDVAVAAS